MATGAGVRRRRRRVMKRVPRQRKTKEGCERTASRLKVVQDGDPASVIQLGIQPMLLQTLLCGEALVASWARVRAETSLGPR